MMYMREAGPIEKLSSLQLCEVLLKKVLTNLPYYKADFGVLAGVFQLTLGGSVKHFLSQD